MRISDDFCSFIVRDAILDVYEEKILPDMAESLRIYLNNSDRYEVTFLKYNLVQNATYDEARSFINAHFFDFFRFTDADNTSLDNSIADCFMEETVKLGKQCGWNELTDDFYWIQIMSFEDENYWREKYCDQIFL